MLANALNALAGRLDALPLATRQELVFQVNHFAAYLLAYNRAYLQKEGTRPDGETIGSGAYSPAYAAYRRGLGLQVGHIDLTLTKAFTEAFRLEYLGGGVFEVQNTDAKAAKLAERYGELLGVRESDILDFIETTIEPTIRAFIGRYMN